MYKRLSLRKINKLRWLRERGYSVPELSTEIGVSKSTALRYVTGVEILPEFKELWVAKRGGSRKRKELRESEVYQEVKSLIRRMSSKDKLLFIAALYWAEGNKRDLAFINSDPRLISIFINGMRGIFNITDDRIRINIRIHSNLQQDICLDFWSRVTGVPTGRFGKTEVVEGKKTGKLQYGMCRIRLLKGADLLKQMVAVNKVVYEIFSKEYKIQIG